MEKKTIVVCGYPKSGTTWLSRLVAELVGCPLGTAFGFDDGPPLEGGDRESEFECRKSHHTFETLASGRAGEFHKLIYIVRDPRDVAISGAHHFQVDMLPKSAGPKRVVAALNIRIDRFLPYRYKLRRIVDAVLNGDPTITDWLAVSWRDHYRGFRDKGVLIVRYEDLLADAVQASGSVLEYLDIVRSRDVIADAVQRQSFDRKKAALQREGLADEYRFLRRGSSGYWRSELSEKYQALFLHVCREELSSLGYADQCE